MVCKSIKNKQKDQSNFHKTKIENKETQKKTNVKK